MTKILLFSFIFLVSCSLEQVTEIDIPEHEPRIVINSILLNNSNEIGVHVGQSAGILKNFSNTVVEGAEVNIYDNGQLINTDWNIQTISGDNQGGEYKELLFVSDLATPIGEEGHSYKIEVNSLNSGTASVTEVMPTTIEILELKHLDKFTIDFEGDTLNYFEVKFKDLEVNDDFYYLEAYIYQNGNRSNMYIESLDPAIEKDNSGDSYEMIFNDNLFNGQNKRIEFSYYNYYDQFNPIDSIEIEFSHINKYLFEYRRFARSLDNSSPFTEPSILKSNVENGYGLFGLGNTISKTFTL